MTESPLMCYNDYMGTPRPTDKCDVCGGAIRVGDWPFCGGDPARHTRMEAFGFDPFTPYVDPNILPYGDPRANASEVNPRLGFKIHGTLITSREQRRAIMRERGLDFAPRPMGEGGTEF